MLKVEFFMKKIEILLIPKVNLMLIRQREDTALGIVFTSTVVVKAGISILWKVKPFNFLMLLLQRA